MEYEITQIPQILWNMNTLEYEILWNMKSHKYSEKEAGEGIVCHHEPWWSWQLCHGLVMVVSIGDIDSSPGICGSLCVSQRGSCGWEGWAVQDTVLREPGLHGEGPQTFTSHSLWELQIG